MMKNKYINKCVTAIIICSVYVSMPNLLQAAKGSFIRTSNYLTGSMQVAYHQLLLPTITDNEKVKLVYKALYTSKTIFHVECNFTNHEALVITRPNVSATIILEQLKQNGITATLISTKIMDVDPSDIESKAIVRNKIMNSFK